MKFIHIEISGKKWKIRFGNPGRDKDAICDYEKREIVLRRKSVGTLLDCIAHEVIHARCPDLVEETVYDLGNLIDEAYKKVVEKLV